jgi:murein DD-endopeptidase MepM/ murein hydrolase activator NlpD
MPLRPRSTPVPVPPRHAGDLDPEPPTTVIPDNRTPAALRPRSPRLVRTLLLSACAAGLTGLSLVGGVASPEAASSPAPTNVLRASDVLPSPIVLQQREDAVPRANRSRPVAATKVVAPVRKAAAKKAVVTKHVLVARWVRPSDAGIISPYGPRWGTFHKGIDFGADSGSPIRAIGNGVVVGTGYQSGESGYGQITIIRHSNGFYSAYAHQSSTIVHEGDLVTAGELIGYVGSTGHVTGPHLHFEIRTEPHGGQLNPTTWLRAHGVDV